MRLLNVSTLQLHEFFDDGIPLYAILSHRWEGDEISFQMMMDFKGMQNHMKGYNKILNCCKQAKNDGFEWVWIDSCCIDKTSSAELSEAINSMFRWYRESQVCYAFLSDVGEGTHDDHFKEDSEFRKSLWFTRGWTLQELIAPDVVVFLNRKWDEIGTKGSLQGLISSITSIQRQALIGFSKDHRFSIAQMMSWASKRTTTRVEDIAYCLLGIFDVNMPLLYGEGEKAFYRLQLEIMKERDDESIFAWDIPKLWTGPSELGMLATHPKAFENASEHHSTPSVRQYTMTNKGIHMRGKLLSAQAILKEDSSYQVQGAFNRGEHFLVLGCNRGGIFRRRLAVLVKRDSNHSRNANLFVRSNPGIFSFPEKSLEDLEVRTNEKDFFLAPQRHHEMQRAAQDLSVLLDIRLPLDQGYSVEQTDQTRQENQKFGEESIKIELKSGCNPIFLSFVKEKDNFILALSSGGGGKLVLQMFGEKNRSQSRDGVGLLLPSGRYVHPILRKRVEDGILVHSVEINIAEDGKLYEEISGGAGVLIQGDDELSNGEF